MAQNDSPPLGKFLASSGELFLACYLFPAHFLEDKATRDKAVKHLVQFLSDSTASVLSDDRELAKLWKGIFYCASPPLSLPCHPSRSLLCTGRRLLDVR